MKPLLFTGSVRAAHGGDIIVITGTTLPEVDAVLIFWNAYTTLADRIISKTILQGALDIQILL
jgi:hypothetical protein